MVRLSPERLGACLRMWVVSCSRGQPRAAWPRSRAPGKDSGVQASIPLLFCSPPLSLPPECMTPYSPLRDLEPANSKKEKEAWRSCSQSSCVAVEMKEALLKVIAMGNAEPPESWFCALPSTSASFLSCLLPQGWGHRREVGLRGPVGIWGVIQQPVLKMG